MIRHLLRLVWNRKPASALIVAEIFVSFLVVFAVIAGASTFGSAWNRPIGFEWRDVWNVRIDIELETRPEQDPRVHETMMRLLREVQALPQVESAAGSNTPPFAFSTMSGGTKVNGQYVDIVMDDVTDDYAKAMRIGVVRGRWFSSADDGAQFRPAILDVNAAKAVFGDENPIGKKIGIGEDGDVQIVGVVREYRKDGETMAATRMMFLRLAPSHAFGGLMRNIVVRVRPGTPADFEQTLVNRLQAVAPDMSFRVRHMDRMRRDFNSFRLAPVILGAIVAAFLISMVALGLTGVLWQNVTRRTREIGLRRATGASGAAVHRQILAEVVLLATFGLIVGCVVVLQLPMLGALAIFTPASFTIGILGALATIYTLTILCGLYPSWLASRLQPAEALRYE